MTKIRVVITGGHHNSALVLARQLEKSAVLVDWIGHRYTSRGDTHDSAEYIEVKTAGIPFHELKAGKLGKLVGLRDILRIPLGIWRANRLLSRLKPHAVISFGGYLGFAVGLVASVRSIPLYIHEQTTISGLSNRLLARIAKRVFLTWDSSNKYFPRDNSTVVGLPLRNSVIQGSSLNYFNNNLPTILVTGGKQGSSIINKYIFTNLEQLLQHYNLIHQTGTSTVTGDYIEAEARKTALNPKLASRYLVKGYIGESEMGTILHSVNLVIGRSGAHITYELGVSGTPSVLIPYPHTYGQEQYHNANFLKNNRLAIIIPESELSYPTLYKAITRGLSIPKIPLDLPKNASPKMVELILHDLQ